MRLKVKFLKWSSGIPAAMLNKKTAEAIGITDYGRIYVETLTKHPRRLAMAVSTIDKVVKENEIVVSAEIKKRLNLRNGQSININIANLPRSLLFIKKKLDNKKLNRKQIEEIIEDVVKNNLSDPEVSLFISAMYKNGMNFKETTYLIKAILKTGTKFKWKNKLLADKHSIGGIPGNRTTPLVIPICAAAGLSMPKTSSRSITSAAGTADVMETIAKIEFSPRELKHIMSTVGSFMVWGGSLGMVPADSKIIRIEKALKIDPEAQLLASIIAKKLASGSKYILIDIPYGKNAKVSRQKGLKLKKKFEKLGGFFRKRIKVVLTDGKQPIGNGVGPALELIDVINILDPSKQGPKDLEDKAILLSAHLLEMTGKAKKSKDQSKAIELAKEMLSSGKAFEKFKQIIKAQKGKVTDLKPGKFKKHIFAKRSGKIKEIHNKKINLLAIATGCPADKFAGLYLNVKLGDKVKKGDKLLTIYSESKPRLNSSIKLYEKSRPIKLG
jgi:AMP phosphorylase